MSPSGIYIKMSRDPHRSRSPLVEIPIQVHHALLALAGKSGSFVPAAMTTSSALGLAHEMKTSTRPGAVMVMQRGLEGVAAHFPTDKLRFTQVSTTDAEHKAQTSTDTKQTLHTARALSLPVRTHLCPG